MLEFEAKGSSLERVDPRSKILIVCLFSAGAIIAGTWYSLLFLLLFLLILWRLARLSLGRQKLIVGILLFSALACILTQSVFYGTFWRKDIEFILFELTSKDTPVVGRLAVTLDGIKHGGIITLKLWVLILTSALLPLTTHPSDLMLALVRIRVPFFIVVIFTMGFRFIPLIQRNLFQLMDAHKLRGIKPLSPRGLSGLLNALLYATLRTADDLALSLETRAFHPSGKRTFYRQISFTIYDVVALTVSSLIMLALFFFEFIIKGKQKFLW